MEDHIVRFLLFLNDDRGLAAISVGDVQRLLGYNRERSSPEALRDRAMLELLYATGMRVTELVSLDIEDVDLQNNSVRCAGKGGRVREIPFGSAAREALARYVERARPSLAGARTSPAL